MDLVDLTLGQVPLQMSLRMTMANIPHGFTTSRGGVSRGI